MQIKIGFPENTIGRIIFAPFFLVLLVIILAAVLLCLPVLGLYYLICLIVAVPIALVQTAMDD